jgi:hypothetical protein
VRMSCKMASHRAALLPLTLPPNLLHACSSQAWPGRGSSLSLLSTPPSISRVLPPLISPARASCFYIQLECAANAPHSYSAYTGPS